MTWNEFRDVLICLPIYVYINLCLAYYGYYIGILRKWKFVLCDVFRLFRAKKFFPDNYIYTYTYNVYTALLLYCSGSISTRRCHCRPHRG